MKKLETGMLLYHGSYTEIKDIKLSECISGKDFGKGFYLTLSYEQAKNFVRLSVKRNKILGKISAEANIGFVNVYKVKTLQNIKVHYFDAPDVEWLHFVAGNRDNTLFEKEVQALASKNVIVGKIANDRTAATLQAYIDGVAGDPGNNQIDKNTIDALLPNRLEDQYCFRNQEAVDTLEFIRSEQVIIDGR